MKKKTIGDLPHEHALCFYETFEKRTRRSGLQSLLGTANIQEDIYTTITDPPDITLKNIYHYVPSFKPDGHFHSTNVALSSETFGVASSS